MVSSAFPGSTFRVYSWLGVRTFNLTLDFNLLTEQDLAFALISMNFSALMISAGITFRPVDTCMDNSPLFICFGA